MATKGDKKRGDRTPFQGYPAPTSNTTYTPNQFFDVVLRHSSRGCVRLVAYMIRKTLGWSDAQGNPQEPQVVISYNQLIREAGISRGAIGPAIEEAVTHHFIRCIREGRASGPRQSAVSALYELCWDDRDEYIKDLSVFGGFYSGNGNLTYIPNAFFDFTVPNESLAVIKVVGAIIRHTIGFQTRFGFRRQQIEMSFTRLQRITGIASRRSLNDAIQHSIKNNHIQRIEAGFFDSNAGQASRAATYGIKWTDTNTYPMNSPKRIPEQAGDFRDPSPQAVQKEYRADSEATHESSPRPVQKADRTQFNKDTGRRFIKDTETGSESKPAPVQKEHRDQSIIDTGIEITDLKNTLNKTSKQQQAAPAAVEGAFSRLKEEGFDRTTATRLAEAFPPLQIIQQCEWLPLRNPTRNRLGLLRKSIEENWPCPEAENPERLGGVFAAHFYAAWAGNSEQPAAAVVRSDVEAGERFVKELLRHYPHEDKVHRMGRSFGEYVRDQELANPGMPRSLKLALTRHGDAFVVDFRRKVRASAKKAADRARKLHYDRFRGDYMDYVRDREIQLRDENPLLYAAFEEEERRQREFLASSPYCQSPEFINQMLAAFDSDKEHLKRFYEYSRELDGSILDFWGWDREFNPTRMGQEVVNV
ncbi:MAG: hypothetical protein KF886_23590 [Candidatus Hydrogenedentes bacterium]|nr:hypothetical protein [Candidatus Hydrogenedentota bacterium]